MSEIEVCVQPITALGYIGLTHGIRALSRTESGNIGLAHVGSRSECPAYKRIRRHNYG